MTQRLEQDRLYHELAQAHGAAMMRLAQSSEANADKRMDLVQMMHVELWKSLQHFDGRCSQKTWVYRVIHNVAASYVRQEARRNTPLLGVEEIDDFPAETDMYSNAEKRDALAKLYAWIRRLKMPDRQILLLYLEDVPTSEISEMLGLSVGAVSTRISRLKSKLTIHFEETNHDKP